MWNTRLIEEDLVVSCRDSSFWYGKDCWLIADTLPGDRPNLSLVTVFIVLYTD